MNGINLLPWRLAEHQKQRRQFLWQSLFCLIITLGFYWIMSETIHQQQEQIAQLNEQIRQHQTASELITTQINQFKQQQQPLNQQATMDLSIFQKGYELLVNLPIEQGELRRVAFQATNFQIQGETPSQPEFEQIHQFLRAQFPQIQLTNFETISGLLRFSFEIPLEKSEKN